jgi:hypothetical protein
MARELTEQQRETLLETLAHRFAKNVSRHAGLEWTHVQTRLEANPHKLWSLHQMELTEGEPDVIGGDATTGEFIFCDCASESPKGRRSLCYDRTALDSRKENKPISSAIETASAMGIALPTEDEYRALQALGHFDAKTSSWLQTPPEIRKLGGALFGDWRYGRVFVYHNGAESYYAARGFRGLLRV